MAAIERSGGFRGLSHVLGGALSPIDGMAPETLRLGELEQLHALPRPAGGGRDLGPKRNYRREFKTTSSLEREEKSKLSLLSTSIFAVTSV